MRDSMVFYRSFMEILNGLPPDECKTLLMAITQYAMDGIQPNLEGYVDLIWKGIKPQIDANNKKAENGKKGAEYGKLGGRPRKNPIGVMSETPNVNVNVNENVNVNNNSSKSKNKFCEFQKADYDIEELESRVFKN